jgi:hypothetical protein
MTTQDSPSLYDRLRGVYSIATVMDDFIDRIMVDPRLNANPRVDEAHRLSGLPTTRTRRPRPAPRSAPGSTGPSRSTTARSWRCAPASPGRTTFGPTRA